MDSKLVHTTEDGFSIYEVTAWHNLEFHYFNVVAPDNVTTYIAYTTLESALAHMDKERDYYKYRLERPLWRFVEKQQAVWDITPEYIYFNPANGKYFEGIVDAEETVHDVQPDLWGGHYWDTLEEARKAIDENQRQVIEDIEQCSEVYDFEKDFVEE